MSTPILILGDGPDQTTGLGRIGHDLAWLLSSMPEFRVGYLGRNSLGRAKYPWQQYSFVSTTMNQWGEGAIDQAYNDLRQGQDGIIFTIWDATRLAWLANKEWPQHKPKLWGYFMQDSEGMNPGRLPLGCASVMVAYDRVCFASQWAYKLGQATLQHADMDWIPHGINRAAFKPIDPLYARSGWQLTPDDIVIGCVMANQERKHWPVVFQAVGQIKGACLWARTDEFVRYWNIPALAAECGMAERTILEAQPLTDAELAMRYSACNATVLISGGEGFAYPAAESLSCGTPVVSGCYSAQADMAHISVPYKASQIVTQHAVKRAVYDHHDVASAIEIAITQKQGTDGGDLITSAVEHLDWPKLGIVWKKWLRKELT